MSGRGRAAVPAWPPRPLQRRERRAAGVGRSGRPGAARFPAAARLPACARRGGAGRRGRGKGERREAGTTLRSSLAGVKEAARPQPGEDSGACRVGTHGILHARRVSMAGECGVFEDAWRGAGGRCRTQSREFGMVTRTRSRRHPGGSLLQAPAFCVEHPGGKAHLKLPFQVSIATGIRCGRPFQSLLGGSC